MIIRPNFVNFGQKNPAARFGFPLAHAPENIFKYIPYSIQNDFSSNKTISLPLKFFAVFIWHSKFFNAAEIFSKVGGNILIKIIPAYSLAANNLGKAKSLSWVMIIRDSFLAIAAISLSD